MAELVTNGGILLAATVNAALWTARVALAASGRRIASATLAGLDALLFVLLLGAVVGALDQPVRVVCFGLGITGGTYVGLAAHDAIGARLAAGRRIRSRAGQLP